MLSVLNVIIAMADLHQEPHVLVSSSEKYRNLNVGSCGGIGRNFGDAPSTSLIPLKGRGNNQRSSEILTEQTTSEQTVNFHLQDPSDPFTLVVLNLEADLT